MALLGILIDKQTLSQAGGEADTVTALTLNHSLPATNPELVLPVLRSVEAMAGDGARGIPALAGLGGNASISTVFVAASSNASVPAVMFDVYQIVFHSVIR